MIMDRVILSNVQRQLRKVPSWIKDKIESWARLVQRDGVRETRKNKGYHDEPLKGKRKGQRSIRLSRAWRAIYRQEKDGAINLIIVEEVNKHDY